MIYVDIRIPAVDQTVDFQLDENAPIHDIVEEVSSLIYLRSGMKEPEEKAKFWLYDLEMGAVLNDAYSLASFGIRNGAELILL